MYRSCESYLGFHLSSSAELSHIQHSEVAFLDRVAQHLSHALQ